MNNKRTIAFITVLIALLAPFYSFADIKLPQIISDGMVLQRNKPVKIWGWANAGERVNIRFRNHTFSTSANEHNQWEVTLPAAPAGGPYVMKIVGNNALIIKDVLIGEVWLCSGQSNMALKMSQIAERYPTEIQKSENPSIRQFLVPNNPCPQRADDVPATGWKSAGPQTTPKFTAVGYFFAKKLYERYHVPIGLITSAYGGSAIEAWTSEKGLTPFPEYLQKFNLYKDSATLNNAIKESGEIRKAWYQHIKEQDKGPDQSNVSAWQNVALPGYLDNVDIKKTDRLIYFKKEIQLPEGVSDKQAVIFLGNIRGEDSTYINGIRVGTAANMNVTRKYVIPEGVLKPGKNIILLRILNADGNWGFVPDEPYQLEVNDKTYSLNGQWQYQVSVKGSAIPSKASFIEANLPAFLFNGMIAPLTNYGIRGILWYQGEHDVFKAGVYRQLLPNLINDWRSKFKQGPLPFLLVQLPGYQYTYGPLSAEPEESKAALLREAQQLALQEPNTGMAVTIDIGEYNNIHPKNKLDVGSRLSLLARNLVYGEKNLAAFGPFYNKSTVQNKYVYITFEHIGAGLMVKPAGAELKGFAIAGADKKFYWANTRIQGGTVVVWNDQVTNPVAVRYAWSDAEIGVNLFNSEGLPAAPFRTDNWSVTKVN